MIINRMNNVNYAINSQSKGNNKTAFGMRFSPEVKSLFKMHAEELGNVNLRRIKCLNERDDGFLLSNIRRCPNEHGGWYNEVVVNKSGHTFIERVHVANKNQNVKDVIVSAIRYLSDLPMVTANFNKQVVKDELIAERNSILNQFK